MNFVWIIIISVLADGEKILLFFYSNIHTLTYMRQSCVCILNVWHLIKKKNIKQHNTKLKKKKLSWENLFQFIVHGGHMLYLVYATYRIVGDVMHSLNKFLVYCL